MDPQKLSQLDPKLRAAYERVMGTAIPQPAQAQTPISPPAPIPDPTPPAPQSQSQPEPEPTPSSTGGPALEPQPVPESQPAATNPQPQFIPTPESIPNQPTSNFTQMNSEVPVPATAAIPNFTAPAESDSAPAPQAQAIVLKKKSGVMMPILFGITGLIFIVIYTLFWTKIFNFKLPFLP